MTDLWGVVAGVQAVLGADPVIGLDGSDDAHLRVIVPNYSWHRQKLPAAGLLATETRRTAQIDRREYVEATVEVCLQMGVADGLGNLPAMTVLVEGVRRVLIEQRLLPQGNPPKATILGSRPTGSTYEVFRDDESGWYHRAIFRWDANWLEPRVFDDAPVIDARHVVTISVIPGVGVTETQEPLPPD